MRELIFAIIKDWFSCWVVIFAIFGKSRVIEIKTLSRFVFELHAKLASETICRDVKYSNPAIGATLSQLHRAFVWFTAATRFYSVVMFACIISSVE